MTYNISGRKQNLTLQRCNCTPYLKRDIDIPANCTLSKVVYGVMTVGTMFCKDNVQDSRITESLPKDWTISSF